MNGSEEKVILKKNGLVFSKQDKNIFKVDCILENQTIFLESIIDFGLIQMIYDLNKDIYEHVEIIKINEHEIQIILLMKHFFEDLGMPRRYSHLCVLKQVGTDKQKQIIFRASSIYSERPAIIPSDAQLMPIENMVLTFTILTPHRVHFHKLASSIISKIFIRTKQFIENITFT